MHACIYIYIYIHIFMYDVHCDNPVYARTGSSKECADNGQNLGNGLDWSWILA